MEGGVLVSTSQYSLTLEQGHLVLRSGESLILSTVSKLKAGVWYRVVLRTYREEARLTVGEEVVQGVGLVSRYLGDTLEVGRGYMGCIEGLAVGHHTLSLVSGGEPFLVFREGLVECECQEQDCGGGQEGRMQGDQAQGERGEGVRVRYRGKVRVLPATQGEVELDRLTDVR